MNKKPTRYPWIMFVIFLSACGTEMVLAPTVAHIPSATVDPPSLLSTSTLVFVTITPSPLPTAPAFPVITPDPIQIERWNEYEEALAKAFFKDYFEPEDVVCEWIVLGQAVQEVYVWGYCSGIYSVGPSSGSIPAVIHFGADGSIENAEIPGSGTAYGEDIRRMFPADIQQRIFGHSVPLQELEDRLRWRRGHPDEPPFMILNSLSTQSTPAIIPWITPNPIQVETWREYQTVLANGFLSYLPPENVLCEWEILGQSDQEVYTWTICTEFFGVGSLEGLVVIYTGLDGSIRGISPRIEFPDEVRRMFPLDVQERYLHGQIHFQELVDHLRLRQRLGREEPPLIVTNTTPGP